MTLRVELVAPDRVVWSGHARMVIAKTLDGDVGVLTNHPPVIGILAEGSVVRVLDVEGSPPDGPSEVVAAVSSGFLSVADDRVSILARQAQLGTQVDTAAVQASLEAAESALAGDQPEAKYSRALLRAAGEQRS
ncbi:MAG TPA: F0F1 ATP synthase subunit epsilon [Streptosporangiaceae bacterium]|nr:F0F1 ATP synthase subunit epsilon [Streptosporangiaceae bacterium]